MVEQISLPQEAVKKQDHSVFGQHFLHSVYNGALWESWLVVLPLSGSQMNTGTTRAPNPMFSEKNSTLYTKTAGFRSIKSENGTKSCHSSVLWVMTSPTLAHAKILEWELRISPTDCNMCFRARIVKHLNGCCISALDRLFFYKVHIKKYFMLFKETWAVKTIRKM